MEGTSITLLLLFFTHPGEKKCPVCDRRPAGLFYVLMSPFDAAAAGSPIEQPFFCVHTPELFIFFFL